MRSGLALRQLVQQCICGEDNTWAADYRSVFCEDKKYRVLAAFTGPELTGGLAYARPLPSKHS